MMMKRFFPLLLLFLLVVSTASAQDGPTQDEVNAVARKLFCPVCENTPLDVCPTEACQQWRDVIRTKLMEGQSEEWRR
jgi:cytochrome c-type biogenesis protein CcmH